MSNQKVYAMEKGSCRGDSFGTEAEISVDKVKEIYEVVKNMEDVGDVEQYIEERCEGSWKEEAQFIFNLCFDGYEESVRDLYSLITEGVPLIIENEESTMAFSFNDMNEAKAEVLDSMDW